MTNIPSGTDARKSVINVRVCKKEKTIIRDNADKQRLSVSAYVRDSALSGTGKTRSSNTVSTSEGKQIALVLACLGRLMDMLKSYAKDTEHQDRQQQLMFAALRREIMTVRDQCFSSLRRKP